MSDRFAATIVIGGQVPRSLVEALCKAIEESGAGPDWGDGTCPTTEEDLMGLAAGNGTIVLNDSEACYGEFSDLEQFLVDHGIPFDRTSEAKWDYDGEVIKFRPGQEPYCLLATQDGQPSIRSEEVEEIVARLDDAEALRKGELLAVATSVRDDLRSLMALDVPDVPPLVIVED